MFRPSLMELGGKSPAIVLPGADLKLAANNVSPFPLKLLSELTGRFFSDHF